MRPLNLDECWICQQQFPDQKTLKRHLASKGTHGGRLSVVCLWCFSYEKRFSRISDLKCHLDEKHPDISPKLEKTFMSEANGNWFSVFPEDYRRIVTKVTPKGSPSAVQARSHVTSWLGKCKSVRRLRQSWVEDWANHPRDTDVVGTPKQGIREPSVESAVSEWEQDVPTITLEEDAPMEEYDPLLPSVLTLHSIQMNADGPLIALFTIRLKEMTWYRIEIDPVIRMVEKFNAALERKANTIRPTDISTMSHSGSPVYGEEFYHKQQMCADTLNISPALITRIERRPDIFSSVSKTKPILAPTNSPLAPTNQSPSATSSIPKPPSSTSKHPSSAPKPPSSTPKPSSSVPKPPSSVTKSPLPASKPSTSTSKPPSSLITSLPVVQPPSSSTDLTITEETPIQKKAREILTLGSMPAIPPARRNWKTKSIKIPTGTTFLQWPPREWETLTPDSKLLAWEFAASQLEYHSSGKFPKLDRVDLLDKYNFLALPGTKEQKIKGKENLVRKCRYYNYEILRTTINKDNPDFKIIVNQLYTTRDLRDTSTDKIIDLCNQSKIPLRLL
ncbi:uncharacterized protein LOC134716828 [Mytilus trossulus]|uniref:uncharacterized protein LOC134716828 n=1 Tax=Mytilus trossulus TaxID=6551 RepID=UPI003007832F